MKKIGKFTLVLFGAFALVQISSCTKLFDHVFGNDHSSKKCRIVSFRQNNVPIGPGSRTAQVYYNHHNDIDSIIADVETGSLGAHRFYFTYDNNRRLIGYREAAGASYPYEEVHAYIYQNGRIVRDSVRIDLYENTQVKTLEYDSYGRVIKETNKIYYDYGPVVDDTNPRVFAYNAEGNLIFGSATYDNRVNFLGSNKHLMFTQRDYSKNNRMGATSYNNRGFPLGFVEGTPATYGSSSLLSFGLPVEIVYDCE